MASATLTFLYTDIEGSTPLWEREPARMRPALEQHDALLRQAVADHHGRVYKTIGDAIQAVFALPSEALAAALQAQRALAAAAWPTSVPVRVRMGLHTGESESAGDDFATTHTLNRAARILSAAHGGQLILSVEVASLLRGSLPAEVSLRDLGQHRLKGLAQREHLYQVVAPGLPDNFPPLASLEATEHNLPVQLTSFIGRARELAEVRQLLDGTRLLTLTGPGGTGKTRLALQLAAEVLASFPDGAWLVELAPLSDPTLVPAAVAAVFNVRDQPGRPLTDSLIDFLRGKQLLLILDNCEHVIDACAQLATRLLTGCPRLKLLPSSREALGIAGETAYRVPSLAVPDDQCATPASLLQFDAARLFVERAQAAQPHFAPTAHNLSVIIQICQRLDGIPLAIELAAARVKLLSVEQIAARLNDRFRLLTGGSRTALPRQQTLRALIDWSYDLLSEPERAALRQLSVFAGGWTLEAAEAVVQEDERRKTALRDETSPNSSSVARSGPSSGKPSPASMDVLDLLSQLANKSLVTVDDEAAEPRYRLLETIRQYARDKLFATVPGEAEAARRRHLDFYLAWMATVEPKLTGPEMIPALDQLEVEQDNLRAATEWGLENDPQAALHLVAMRRWFWVSRASATDGLKWTTAALARAEAAPPESAAALASLSDRARVLEARATLLFALGDNLASREAIEASITLARQINAPETLAYALGMGATVAGMLGDVGAASAWGQESLALSRQHGLTFGLAMFSVLHMFMSLVAHAPLPAGAMEEAVQAARASGNPFAIAMAIQSAGRLAVMGGQDEAALARYEEAARIFEQMGDRLLHNSSRSEIGHVRRRQGRLREALDIYRETIPVWQELGQHGALAHEVESLGFLALAGGQLERAARLLGAAEAERERLRTPMTTFERDEYDQAVAALRQQLGAAALEAVWAAGRGMTLDAAVAYGLEDQG